MKQGPGVILPTFDTLIDVAGMKSVDLVASGPYWNATAYEQIEC